MDTGFGASSGFTRAGMGADGKSFFFDSLFSDSYFMREKAGVSAVCSSVRVCEGGRGKCLKGV